MITADTVVFEVTHAFHVWTERAASYPVTANRFLLQLFTSFGDFYEFYDFQNIANRVASRQRRFASRQVPNLNFPT